MIAGLLQSTGGYITFYSDDFQTPGIGYMLQHDHLLEWRDVYHNILLGLEIQHKLFTENIELVNQLLIKYHLENTIRLKPSALSGGMRQRLALARTLFMNPEIILMDEPLSALDIETRGKMQDLIINQHKETNNMIIMVTHSKEEAQKMCDVIIEF